MGATNAGLFDDDLDTPARAIAPKGDGPVAVTSVVEALFLNLVAWFIFSCYLPGIAGSPREAEWFGWAPAGMRHWLLHLDFAAFVTPFQTILPLVFRLSLPPGWKRRLPLRFLPGGSPPLLGALALVILGFLPLALMALLAMAFPED
jgi:hypothetical protein